MTVTIEDPSIPKEIQRQISQLLIDIDKAKREVKQLAADITHLRKEISAFLDEYYFAVERDAWVRDGVRGENKDYEQADNPLLDEALYGKQKIEVTDEQIRLLYKKVMQAIEPLEPQKHHDVHVSLTKAFKDKDLASMLFLDHYAEIQSYSTPSNNAVMMLEALEVQKERVTKRKDQLYRQKQALLQTPENKLRMKSDWYKMYGDDLFMRVRERMRSKKLKYVNRVISSRKQEVT